MSLLAVRPPEYFPRPEFYALMAAVDVFVLADTFQYSRQSFQNRARIRTPDGWSWLSIPLKGGQHGRAVCNVQVDDSDARWPARHWRSLEYNYRSSPFFEFYEDTVAPILSSQRQALSAYTVETVETLKNLLQIDTRIVRASTLDSRPKSMEAVLALYPGWRL
ncbi:MAG: WbqC family protein, partial [Rhodothermales bacterium]|nr:WbqC family protein [Rhodothermales bacterium]